MPYLPIFVTKMPYLPIFATKMPYLPIFATKMPYSHIFGSKIFGSISGKLLLDRSPPPTCHFFLAKSGKLLLDRSPPPAGHFFWPKVNRVHRYMIICLTSASMYTFNQKKFYSIDRKSVLSIEQIFYR